MKILKSNLFWSILQTFIAIVGFCILCYEMRLGRIRDEQMRAKYMISQFMQFNYDKIEGLLNDVKNNPYYCESHPESVSDDISIIEANFDKMYEMFFKNNYDLFIEVYNEKKFSDFVKYFITCDRVQNNSSNLFNYTTKGWKQCISNQLKWRCQNMEKDDIRIKIRNIVDDITKDIIDSYA